jgi:asparagine synthetase B (glutamine-hydrolysing)
MPVLYIGKSATNFINCKIGFGHYQSSQFDAKGYCHDLDDEFIYCSERPIIKSGSKYRKFDFAEQSDLQILIAESQNNFAAIRLFNHNAVPHITIASSRFARARIFFTRNDDGFYFSDDLRELLPYTTRRLNHEGAYSIIKFGNTPEFITCVQDIFAVPVASYITIGIDELLRKASFAISDFQNYFHLTYTYEGGNIQDTESLLEDIFDYVAEQDFIVPISGGIDSSLMNYMISKRTEKKYPAYFLSFGDKDPEIKYAKESVKNTNADLEIYTMNPSDFIDAFNFQSEHTIQPIGETSAISMSQMFRNFKFQNTTILDGTLADGCYGSKNYLKPLFSSLKERSSFSLKTNEQIASFLHLHNLPFSEKFFPRDSQISDPFLQLMNVYVGPFSNTMFIQADKMNNSIIPYWLWYYNLTISESGEKDEWMKYSIFKMINYASNTTIAKTYDLCGATNNMLYPFMFKDILNDQGKYTWEEKTKDGIIKYPLKKIIEKYASKEFIYRKKAGLNSSTEDWIAWQPNKMFLADVLSKNDSVAASMIGAQNLRAVIKSFRKEHHHPNVSSLVMSLAMIETWCDKNGVKL